MNEEARETKAPGEKCLDMRLAFRTMESLAQQGPQPGCDLLLPFAANWVWARRQQLESKAKSGWAVPDIMVTERETTFGRLVSWQLPKDH